VHAPTDCTLSMSSGSKSSCHELQSTWTCFQAPRHVLPPYYVVIMFLLNLVSMQSYFGGVCCVCWSPDGRYIAAGGEDDLVSIYGMAERGVVAWGEGHSSWVMQVAFDPW